MPISGVIIEYNKITTFLVNQFRNRIVISEGNSNSKRTKIFFQKYIRHVIEYSDVENLYPYLETSVNSRVVNAICCDLPIMAKTQNHILETFPSIKFVHTERMVIYFTNQNDQIETAHCEHIRIPRCANENFKQLLEDYFFPGMKKLFHSINKNCIICM